jgi:signal transduction histidine kinase
MKQTCRTDSHRLEDAISRLRLVVVAITGFAWWMSDQPTLFVCVWLAGIAYSTVLVVFEPHRHLPGTVWRVAVSVIDWGLIAGALLLTIGTGELYVLFFLLVLSLALRIEPFGVAAVGVATAGFYLAANLWLATDALLATILLRTGYLLCISVGSAAVAAEIRGLIRARSRAEAGRSAAQDITAALSHDLLNPLSAILGFVETLQDSDEEPLTATQRQVLTRVTINARRMNRLIRNLLDSEALERGTPSLVLRAVDVNALVDRCADANAGDANAKDLAVELALDPALKSALVDELLIERLVSNLLHNAIKFTPTNGSVRISTRRGGTRFEVEVWNSGPPIADDLIPVLFEKHTRSPESPGVGLGLYICNLAARLHGGEISVRHPHEGGVAFTVSLPLNLPRDKDSARRARVTAVSDEPPVRANQASLTAGLTLGSPAVELR